MASKLCTRPDQSLLQMGLLQVGGGVEILGRLYAANETFRGQIRHEHLRDATAEVPVLPLLQLSDHIV